MQIELKTLPPIEGKILATTANALIVKSDDNKFYLVSKSELKSEEDVK